MWPSPNRPSAVVGDDVADDEADEDDDPVSQDGIDDPAAQPASPRHATAPIHHPASRPLRRRPSALTR